MTIWIDVDDLIGYFYAGNRPSGIQRLSFDLACALIDAGEGHIKACRHGPGMPGFTEIDWVDCRTKLSDAMHGAGEHGPVDAAVNQGTDAVADLSAIRRAARGLPLDLRGPVARIYVAERNAFDGLRHFGIAQVHALRAMRDLVVGSWRWIRPRRRVAAMMPVAGVHESLPADVAPEPVVVDRPVQFAAGDVLISTGATWQFPHYGAQIDHIRAMGVRFAPFAHDMVPLLFPEWSVKATTEAFERWARGVLTRADVLFANSDATARDVAHYARRTGLVIPPAIKLPMGASFPRAIDPDAPRLHERPFVLFVSTIEPRKNHAGMLRLWRRLIDELPAEQVPDLVLAGRVGWLAHDVVAQAENADWFGGKLRLIQGPSDAELASLYRDCLFTVYPSFYEGWGLPVTEGLSFGRPVAASNRASIPEAGGPFCAYFDPEDMNDAYRVISRMILEPAIVAALEDRIAREFRPPSWADSAAAIIAALGDGREAVTALSDSTALLSRTG